jgi:hypothetical protein
MSNSDNLKWQRKGTIVNVDDKRVHIMEGHDLSDTEHGYIENNSNNRENISVSDYGYVTSVSECGHMGTPPQQARRSREQ